jgi:hypothetical protein
MISLRINNSCKEVISSFEKNAELSFGVLVGAVIFFLCEIILKLDGQNYLLLDILPVSLPIKTTGSKNYG